MPFSYFLLQIKKQFVRKKKEIKKVFTLITEKAAMILQ